MLVTSYFSYKGGSGRSSLIYNTIPFLVEKLNASKEHPIILVDLDADSAGLSYLLTENEIKKEDPNFFTTNMLLNTKETIFSKYAAASRGTPIKPFTEFGLYEKFLPVGAEFGLNHITHGKSVLFVPVQPTKTISKFDGTSNLTISNFLKVCENYGAAAVIFDMPAGGQIIGKTVFEESDKIVVVMRITRQHRKGTIDFLKGKALGVAGEFIPLFNVVPQEKIVINGREFNLENVRKEVRDDLEKLRLELDSQGSECRFDFDMLNYDKYGIPEVKRFKFSEGVLCELKNDREYIFSNDEEEAYKAYEYLAEVIAKDFN